MNEILDIVDFDALPIPQLNPIVPLSSLAHRLGMNLPTIQNIRLAAPELWSGAHLVCTPANFRFSATDAEHIEEEYEIWVNVRRLKSVTWQVPNTTYAKQPKDWVMYFQTPGASVSIVIFNSESFVGYSKLAGKCVPYFDECIANTCGKCDDPRTGDSSKYGGEFFVCPCAD